MSNIARIRGGYRIARQSAHTRSGARVYNWAIVHQASATQLVRFAAGAFRTPREDELHPCQLETQQRGLFYLFLGSIRLLHMIS